MTMKWIFEVSLMVYQEEQGRMIMYSQFDSQTKAFKFSQMLFESLMPDETAEVRIRVIPQEV